MQSTLCCCVGVCIHGRPTGMIAVAGLWGGGGGGDHGGMSLRIQAPLVRRLAGVVGSRLDGRRMRPCTCGFPLV